MENSATGYAVERNIKKAKSFSSGHINYDELRLNFLASSSFGLFYFTQWSLKQGDLSASSFTNKVQILVCCWDSPWPR